MDSPPRKESNELSPPLTLGQFGSLPKSTLIIAAWVAALVLFIYFLYPAFGNGETPARWAWNACNSTNGYLHGRFIPFAFLVMVWIGIKRAKDEPIQPAVIGLGILLLGILFYLLAKRTLQPRLVIVGAPFTIIGLVWFIAGFRVARHFVFPAFFWWFTIPVPGLEAALTGRLQTLITQSCYHAGSFIGMDLTSQGSTIKIAGEGFDIAEGCSGIRSLMALTMIAAVYANYTQKSLWKKAVLFASALPLAIIGNFFRIFTILLLAHVGLGNFASKTYHDWAGLLLFFPIALAGLYLVDYLLNYRSRKKKKKRSIVRKSSTTPQSTSS